jgi:hypothetical protein
MPAGSNNLSYSVILTNPINNKLTTTFNQLTTSTPTLSLLNALPLTAGSSMTVKLDRTTTTLNNKTVGSIDVFNVLTPNKFYPVSDWLYNGTVVNFTYTFPAGRYGFRVFFPGYGWASCSTYANVEASPSYSVVGTTTSSILGGVLTVTGTNISPDSTIKIGGFVGNAIAVSSNSATFNIPPLITTSTLTSYPGITK